MRLDNLAPFPTEPSIEVCVAGRPVDLHNFANFTGYTYDTTGVFAMSWQVNDGPKVLHLSLTFSEVRSVAISARNPDLPAEEDRTLSEYWYDPQGQEVRFAFAGGAEIWVRAGSVRGDLTAAR